MGLDKGWSWGYYLATTWLQGSSQRGPLTLGLDPPPSLGLISVLASPLVLSSSRGPLSAPEPGSQGANRHKGRGQGVPPDQSSVTP